MTPTCSRLFVLAVYLIAMPAAAQTASRDTLALPPGDAWGVEAGTWETGVPSTGPGACLSGATCFATVLGDSYAEPVASRLVRYVPFVVPPATRNPRLAFWQWYDFGAADFGRVEVRLAGGDWEQLSPTYAGSGGGVWSRASLSLIPYAGESIELAFYLESNDSPSIAGADVRPGWYIDGVQVISGFVYFNALEDFEDGLQDWSASEGTWQVGTPSAGPAACLSGEQCAGTVLDGFYREPVDSRLMTPPVLVLGEASVRFDHWFSFQASDFGELQYRLVAPTGEPAGDWVRMAGPYTNTSSNVWSSPPPAFLPVPPGSIVQIGFRFVSDDAPSRAGSDVAAGWYIDNVRFNGMGDTALPVSLTAFEAVADGSDVVLTWHTASERNNAGFRVQHQRDGAFATLGFVEGHGTTSEVRTYTFRVTDPGPGTHRFRLEQVDFDGTAARSPAVTATVGLAQRATLEPAYPNPFNPQTTIRFAVQEAQPVVVELYNAAGQRVDVLYRGTPPAGSFEDVRLDGSGLPSGHYFVYLKGEGILATRTITLLK